MLLSEKKAEILLNQMRQQLGRKDLNSPDFDKENQALVDECRIHYPQAGFYEVLSKIGERPVNGIEFFDALIRGTDKYPDISFLECYIKTLSESKYLEDYLLVTQFAMMVFPQLQMGFTFKYKPASKEENEIIRKFIKEFLKHIADHCDSFDCLTIKYLHLGQDNRMKTLTPSLSKTRALKLIECNLTDTPITSLNEMLKAMKQTHTLDLSYTSLCPLQSNLFNTKPTPFQLFCNHLMAMPALETLVLEGCHIPSLQIANLQFLLEALKQKATRDKLNLSFDIDPFEIERTGKDKGETIKLLLDFIRDYPGSLKCTVDYGSGFDDYNYEHRCTITKTIEEPFMKALRERQQKMDCESGCTAVC